MPLRYALGIFLILVISLGLFYFLMHPPMGDLRLMAEYLTITALISVGTGYAAYRLGWIERSPSLLWSIMGGYALASLLAFFNVWVSARLMFISPHDLELAFVLLFFAGGIAMFLGYFLSSAITHRLQALNSAAEAIQNGDLQVRVPENGQDELAALAKTFNQTARRLEETAEKQRELDTMRRDLVAWAGHDLQTPLASVRAVLEALADRVVDDPETVQRYLRTALRDVQTLSLLIDDLFQVAQLDAGGLILNREEASLSDLISDTLESFSELALQRHVDLHGEVAPGVPAVYMDVPRINRVLNNLIDNALRHTPPGGLVALRAFTVPQGVRVEVEDSGEGITNEDLPHLFERFYRGEKSRSRLTGGSGLGLAIARGIVEAHGGEIGVESEDGEGAVFYFTLPELHS